MRDEAAVAVAPGELLVENSRRDSQTAANFFVSESQQLHTETITATMSPLWSTHNCALNLVSCQFRTSYKSLVDSCTNCTADTVLVVYTLHSFLLALCYENCNSRFLWFQFHTQQLSVG